MEDNSIESIQLTQKQFRELLNRIQSTSNKTFTQCSAEFHGERDYIKVEQFITAIKIYKDIEGISDEDALYCLPLLLKDTANIWWQGIKGDIKTWSSALEQLRLAFAPPRQPYEIYIEFFATSQGQMEKIDTFLCRKRALLALLPANRHNEEEQLDLIYGLLKMDLKKRIARKDIKTFTDLLDQARHQESLELEEKNAKEKLVSSKKIKSNSIKKGIRCSFCAKRGHSYEECCERLAKLAGEEDNTEQEQSEKPTIKCYGCGAVGVVRSKCSKCKIKEISVHPVAFYNIRMMMKDHVKIPSIEIMIKGRMEYAYLDTAAQTSIAGRQLYKMLLETGVTFMEQSTDVSLADGTVKLLTLQITTIDITLGGRTLPITLSAIPEADDNCTLLGIDFLEAAGIVLNLPQHTWYFLDNPNKKFNFLELSNNCMPPFQAGRKRYFNDLEDKTESVSDFLRSANQFRMISPLPNTSAPVQELFHSLPKMPRWQ